jgi:hypothetical protein
MDFIKWIYYGRRGKKRKREGGEEVEGQRGPRGKEERNGGGKKSVCVCVKL